MTDHPFFPAGPKAKRLAYHHRPGWLAGLFGKRAKSEANTPIDFFYRADDPISHLMAQILLLLKGQGLSGIRCRVVEKLPLPFFPEPERYEAHRILDAVRLARLYGLQLPLSARVPDRLNVQMVACHLARLETQDNFLSSAVLLGQKLWANDIAGIREHCSTAEMDAAIFRENEAFLYRAGGYESGCVKVADILYQGPTQLKYAFKARPLSAAGSLLVHNLYPSFSGFRPSETPVNIFLALDCPFSYLAAHKLCALGPEKLGPYRIRPVMLQDLMETPQPEAKAAHVLSTASAEAAALGLAFLQKPSLPLTRERLLPDYKKLLAEDDQAKRLKLFYSQAKALWSGMQPAGLNKGGGEHADIHQRLLENAVELRQTGLWGTPVVKAQSGAYWGQDRLFLLSLHQ